MKKSLRLEIEPIPVSTWGISLANKLPRVEWDKIRHKVYKEANWTCQICGDTSRVLHAHEIWRFDNKRKIQGLVRIECVCKLCHDVKHFGRSTEVYTKTYVGKLLKHWCEINQKKEKDFYIYQAKILEISKKRADIFYVVKVGRRILV